MTNLDARLVYENAKDALQKAFPNIPNIAQLCKLTQSTYRFELPLTAGNTLYRFNVLANEPVFFNTEKRLVQQDSAVIYQLGVFLGLASSSTDTSFTPITYPDASFTQANAAKSLYNGYLSVTVNNDILLPHWDLFKHLNIPERVDAAISSPELRGGFDGFEAMEPNIVLIGSKNNVIEIKLPSGGISAVDANSRLIVIARAITAQNSTVVS